jgi:ribose transport system substrate-binding protein
MAVALAAVATVAVVASVGASAQRSAPTAAHAKVKAVAFFGFAAANSFAQATWAGVKQTAAKNNVTAKFFDPNFNAQTQVSQIQDAITTGRYQAFVIQANDGNAVIPAIKQPVWNGTSLAKLGIQACKGLNPCNVAYLEGFKSLPLDNARTEAVKKQLGTASNVKLVADVEGGYTQASGLKAAQDALQAHPDINVIIGSSQAIEGAQQAVKAAGKQGTIKLIGNGGSCQAVAGVRNGTWFATYIIAEKSSGAKATQFAIDAANGKKVPLSFDTRQLQNPLGTKATLGNFKAQYCD